MNGIFRIFLLNMIPLVMKVEQGEQNSYLLQDISVHYVVGFTLHLFHSVKA